MSWEHDDAIRSMLRRASLVKVDDSGTQQLVDVSGLVGDKPQKIVRLQQHGFSSVPTVGSEGLIAALGGRSDRLYGLGFEDKNLRPKNTPDGASVVYFDGANMIVVDKSAIKVVQAIDVQINVGGMIVRVRPGRIDLGSMNAPNAVMTTAGPSSKVFAEV